MTRRQGLGVALLRIMVGVVYVMHGYLGASVLGPGVVAQYVKRAGFPVAFADAFAWYVIVAHALGGLMLIIGFWTAVAALAQLPIMAGATFFIHLPQGFFMRGFITDAAAGRTIAGGYEFALLVLAATVTLVLTGGGGLSLDGRKRYRSPFTR